MDRRALSSLIGSHVAKVIKNALERSTFDTNNVTEFETTLKIGISKTPNEKYIVKIGDREVLKWSGV